MTIPMTQSGALRCFLAASAILCATAVDFILPLPAPAGLSLRERWDVNSIVEVFSTSQNVWCEGTVTSILLPKGSCSMGCDTKRACKREVDKKMSGHSWQQWKEIERPQVGPNKVLEPQSEKPQDQKMFYHNPGAGASQWERPKGNMLKVSYKYPNGVLYNKKVQRNDTKSVRPISLLIGAKKKDSKLTNFKCKKCEINIHPSRLISCPKCGSKDVQHRLIYISKTANWENKKYYFTQWPIVLTKHQKPDLQCSFTFMDKDNGKEWFARGTLAQLTEGKLNWKFTRYTGISLNSTHAARLPDRLSDAFRSLMRKNPMKICLKKVSPKTSFPAGLLKEWLHKFFRQGIENGEVEAVINLLVDHLDKVSDTRRRLLRSEGGL